MYFIAVCDDEKVLCSQFEKILEPYVKNGDLQVDVYYSGEKLYEAMLEGKHYDLIFLDIIFETMNGVDVGWKIRNELEDDRVQLVFISVKQEYAMELFALRPMNFLVKPISEAAVIQNVEKAIQLTGIYDSYFEFKVGNELFRIPYGDILYFESRRRKIYISTKKGVREMYGKLNLIGANTPPGFVRTHQSYLINKNYVVHWKYDMVEMSDGSIIPISQTCRKRVSDVLYKSER